MLQKLLSDVLLAAVRRRCEEVEGRQALREATHVLDHAQDFNPSLHSRHCLVRCSTDAAHRRCKCDFDHLQIGLPVSSQHAHA